MNLHIVPDNVFINKFYDNLTELGLAGNNRIAVRTNGKALKYIRHDLPFAKPYTKAFEHITGPTDAYDRVYIHLFTPLLYRWVATHSFRELNWMVWGADLYNLPSVKTRLYEELTWSQYVRSNFSWRDFLYRTKVYLLHERFRRMAYGKVSHVLTWMKSEYDFAAQHLTGLRAGHQFFFYENDMPYQALDAVMNEHPQGPRPERPLYILGNSSTPELNHIDAVSRMESSGVQADLLIPVSYGDRRYAEFLRKELKSFRGGELRFVDRYMNFNEYLQFLNQADGLIMNNIRPQGYGNIFMMMYLGKKVFLNEDNLSIPELDNAGLRWLPLSEMAGNTQLDWKENKTALLKLLSHEVLLRAYRDLFS